MAVDNTPVYSTTTPPPNEDADAGDTGNNSPDVTGTSVQDVPVTDDPTAPQDTEPVDVPDDPNEVYIVYTDADGKQQRITLREYIARGL